MYIHMYLDPPSSLTNGGLPHIIPALLTGTRAAARTTTSISPGF